MFKCGVALTKACADTRNATMSEISTDDSAGCAPWQESVDERGSMANCSGLARRTLGFDCGSRAPHKIQQLPTRAIAHPRTIRFNLSHTTTQQLIHSPSTSSESPPSASSSHTTSQNASQESYRHGFPQEDRCRPSSSPQLPGYVYLLFARDGYHVS